MSHFANEAMNRWAVRALMAFGRVYARGFHEVKVLSACTLPKTGAAILVCNHTSGLDPVLIQSACPRLVTWMMAKEFYDIGWLQWGFKLIHAIPVERSGKELSATRAALRALQEGRVVGIFPEGRIERTRELMPFEAGVAMLASRSGADVYPAYLDGTQRAESDMLAAFTRRQSATLAFGRAIAPSAVSDIGGKPDLEAETGKIRAGVEALRLRVSSVW